MSEQPASYSALLQIMVDALAARALKWATLGTTFSLFAVATVVPSWERVTLVGVFAVFALLLIMVRRERTGGA